MAIRTIQYGESLDSTWEELIYTEARLLGDANAKDLAPVVAALLEREEVVRHGQRAVWRQEIIAQASVDAGDDAVDDSVAEVGHATLHAVGGDRKSPRFTRYFAQPPHVIIRMGLQAELDRIREWPGSLKTEPEPELAGLGQRLERDAAGGRAALDQRAKASAARSDQRVREIVTFVDDVNAARFSLYGMLIQRVAEKGLPREWPERFFRHSTRSPRPANPEG